MLMLLIWQPSRKSLTRAGINGIKEYQVAREISIRRIVGDYSLASIRRIEKVLNIRRESVCIFYKTQADPHARARACVCNEEDTLMVDKYTKNTFNALNNLSSAVSHERGSRSWYLQNSYLMLQEHGSSFSSDFARLSSLLDRIARTFIDTHAREEIRPALPILPLGTLTKILYYKANLVLRITRYWSRAHALRRNNLT